MHRKRDVYATPLITSMPLQPARRWVSTRGLLYLIFSLHLLGHLDRFRSPVGLFRLRVDPENSISGKRVLGVSVGGGEAQGLGHDVLLLAALNCGKYFW